MCDGLSDLGKVADDPRYLLAHGLRHFHHTQGYGLNAQLTAVLVHQTQLQSPNKLGKKESLIIMETGGILVIKSWGMKELHDKLNINLYLLDELGKQPLDR